MKIVGLEYGRLALLVDLLELGGGGGMHATEMVAAVCARYKFAVPPKIGTQAEPQSVLRFEHGRAPNEKGIALFEVHPQGLVAQASDTETADDFLRDVLIFAKQHFGAKEPGPLSTTIYTSALVAEFKVDLSGLIAGWSTITSLLGGELKARYGVTAPVEVHRLTLRPDPERMTPRLSGLLSDFTLERRTFVPYAAQRYYSIAPLPTDKHVELLTKLEKLAQ